MPRAAADDRRWDARIARARQLAAEHPAACEILTFYAELAGFQKAQVGAAIRFEPGEAIERAASAVPDFLALLGRTAPARLADAAAAMRAVSDAEWRALFERYWRADAHDVPGAYEAMLFVVEALLQPFAEVMAMGRDATRDQKVVKGAAGDARCPACAGRPVVGVLREDGQSARRSLVCGLCLTEWPWPRVVCPACGEDEFDALSVYTSDTFAMARVDACETCRKYVKTIDLSKNALAIPWVDELAGVPLDLWARDQGYTKLRPNLLRM